VSAGCLATGGDYTSPEEYNKFYKFLKPDLIDPELTIDVQFQNFEPITEAEILNIQYDL